ncbi:hemolysin-III channel protein Izh2 [Aspergillus floccosus]
MGVRKRIHRERTSNETPCSKTTPRLLNNHEVPLWYAQNGYILTSYRPVTPSARLCLQSLAYLHNETVNIYSHLVPAVVALLANYLLTEYFASRFPHASWRDQLVFHIYLTTSVMCFGVSSAYHTLLCHSALFADLWARLDYAAITVQILGSFISGIYIGFYCEPHLQRTYWSMISLLSLLTAYVVLHPRLQDMRWRSLRLFMFVATGFSAFAPIVHAALVFPYAQLDQQAGLRYYYLEGLVLLTGVVFYATRFPESWVPKRFDILGSSHQIFHLMVVAGAVIHLCGILMAFRWNYEHQRCHIS